MKSLSEMTNAEVAATAAEMLQECIARKVVDASVFTEDLLFALESACQEPAPQHWSGAA
jgi:hypothetical protein